MELEKKNRPVMNAWISVIHSPKLPLCLDMDKHCNDKGTATVMVGGVSCGMEYLTTWWNSCHAADVYVLPMTSC